MSNLIKIGEIVGVHGVKGEVRVITTSEFPQRLLKLNQVTLRRGQEIKQLQVSSARAHKGLYILTFEGVVSRNTAETLRGYELVVAAQDTLPLPPGQWYIWQIIGCEVFNSETGQLVGKVTQVLQPPANDVYVVEAEGKTNYIPATKEVVRNVDINLGRIEIYPLAGMLE